MILDNMSLEINDYDDLFIILEEYPDIETLIIRERIINDYMIINNFLEKINLNKLKILDCYFLCNESEIRISLFNDMVKLKIKYCNKTVKNFFLNLPNYIEILHIDFNHIFNLTDCFTNLPSTLKELCIFYNYRDNKFPSNFGLFNCFFNIKKPFDCVIKISLLDNLKILNYVVDYDEKGDKNELFLISKINEKIIVKYIEKSDL